MNTEKYCPKPAGYTFTITVTNHHHKLYNNFFCKLECELWVWMGERQMELGLTMVTRPTWEETALGGIRGTTRVTILVTIHVTIRVTTSSQFLTSCDNVDKLKWSWQGCFKMLKWVSRYWECRQVGQMELYQNEKCSLSTLLTHVENSREQFDRFGRWLGGCRSFLIRCRYGCATENVWGQPSNWESMVRRGHSVIEMTNTSEECQTAFIVGEMGLSRPRDMGVLWHVLLHCLVLGRVPKKWKSMVFFGIFSCPQQLNRWPCHTLPQSLTHFYFWHYRATLWPLRHLIRVIRRHDLTNILRLTIFWQFFDNFQQF